MNKRLNHLEENFKNSLEEQINEIIMSVKDTIINTLKQDSSQPWTKVKVLEKKLNDPVSY